MIRVFSLYDGWLLTEITHVCKSVALSASKDQPARKCDLTILYSLSDKNLPRVQIGPGTLITIKEDTYGEIFRGQVIDRSLNSSGQDETITCMDYMRFIMNSSMSLNIKNLPPEDVVKKVCEEVGISTGDVIATGIPINRVCPDKKLYSIIMQCYTQVCKQNGKQYIPIMRGDKFCMIEKGQVISNYVIQSLDNDPYNNNLISLTYKDSIGNMVNRVKIYDSNGNYLDKVEYAIWVQRYGVLQTTYQVEDDKNPQIVAQNKLTGINEEISIEGVGDYSCITGSAVKCKVWYLDILKEATLYIDGDSHTWECGTGKYTMQLTASLTNLMDLQEADG